jgi:hypothetical protein
MPFVARVLEVLPGMRPPLGRLRCVRQVYVPALRVFEDADDAGPIDVVNVREDSAVEAGQLVTVYPIDTRRTLPEIVAGTDPPPAYACEA